MKKLITLLAITSVVVTGCSFGDLFIDEVEVHNGLIKNMDGVLMAEENFYNEYWALADDSDVTPFIESFNEFETAVTDLDEFYTDTKFTSGQQIFIDEYNEYYADFMDDYLDDARSFKEKVETDGYTFESMEPYFADLDKFTEDFVEMHNKLIDTINVQADYTSSGLTY